jgi:hypothetical protein
MTPTYAETYRILITQNNVAKIWKALKRTVIPQRYALDELELCHDEEGFPYLSAPQSEMKGCSVGYAAMMISVFLELEPGLLGHEATEFYVPIVVLPRQFDVALGGSRDLALRHEVLHVKDLVRLMDADRHYVDKVRELAFGSLSDDSRLAESVDFELWKQSYFEVPATKMEYAQGERTLRFPFFTTVIEHVCHSEREYTHALLRNNVLALLERYRQRFPERAADLDGYFDSALLRHGPALFGHSASLGSITAENDEFIAVVGKHFASHCRIVVREAPPATRAQRRAARSARSRLRRPA